MPDVEVRLKLQPKEQEFLRTVEQGSASVVGYGGAKGGGKSHGLRSVMVLRRLKYPGTTGLIFRKHFDDLWQNHIVKFLEEWPDLRHLYNGEHKSVELPGGSRLLFRYADTEQEILDFRGKEYGDVGPDEAAEIPEEWLKILFTSCRSTVAGFKPRKLLTFNPGGPGHAFVKRVFVDRNLTPEEQAQGYAFVQAYGWDNVFWCLPALTEQGFTVKDYFGWPDGERREFFLRYGDYAKELLGLPEYLRDAWLYGRWDVFAGQMFSCALNEYEEGEVDLPEYLPRWISIDWGFEHNSAAYWQASDGSTVYTFREHVENHRTPVQLAERIVEITHGMSRGTRIAHVFLSPDAFAKRTSERTIAIEMGEVFLKAGLPEPTPADTDRAGGWSLMLQMLLAGQWRISRGCRELLRVLPTLVRDERRPGDVVKVAGDDPADAARYGIKTAAAVVVKPREVRVEERIRTEIRADADLTSKAIHARRISEEERETFAPIFRSQRMARLRRAG